MDTIMLVIRHDGKHWVACNETLQASAPTLEALDARLEHLVREKGYVQTGRALELYMAFDDSTIPQWLRQYADHYFNRVVKIKG